jgi:hypothetical protein
MAAIATIRPSERYTLICHGVATSILRCTSPPKLIATEPITINSIA